MSADTREAVACGALGCTNTHDLQRYEQDGVERTLCPELRRALHGGRQMTHPETFKWNPDVVCNSKAGHHEATRVATQRKSVAERGHDGTYAPSPGDHITVSLARPAEAPYWSSALRGGRVAT